MSIVLATLLNATVLLSAPGEGWMAGVARTDITPQESIWLSGYAGRDRGAEETLHSLWVKALVLQDAQGHQGVLISNDLLGYPKNLSDRIRDRLKTAHGLERDQIIINASHTHSAPVVGDSLVDIYPLDEAELAKIYAYEKWLEEQVLATVAKAMGALEPVTLSSANGVTRFAVNRRNNKEHQIQTTHDFNGPVDHAVPVLRINDAEGKTKIVLFGYACHATTLNGYAWCGDWPGFAQIAVEEASPDVTAMFFAGCGADQNPLPRRTVTLAKQYGQELAAAVLRVLAEPMQDLEAEFTSAYSETELLLGDPPSREVLSAIANGKKDYMKRGAAKMLAKVEAGEALRSSYPYPLVVWRLGDLPLVAMGGEVVVGYAVSIKEMLGSSTFVLGYSNDVMSYIPTEIVLKEGGYEGDSSQMLYGLPSKWQPGIEKKVLDAVAQLAKETGLSVKE